MVSLETMQKIVGYSQLHGRQSRRRTRIVPRGSVGLVRDGYRHLLYLVPYNLVTPLLLDVDPHI